MHGKRRLLFPMQLQQQWRANLHPQLFEKRAITASSTTRSAGVISLEQDGMNNNGNKKNRPLTSASMVDLHGDGGTATIQPTDFVRPNTAAQFPSWHYED